MPIGFSFNMPFEEAVEYFQNKGLKLSYNYYEMQKEAHNKAFTVAKVTRVDLLNDLQDSLSEAIKNGEGFSEWKSKIKPTLKKYGWYGKIDSVNPRTGEVKEIHIGSRRLRTIYDTNLRMAYNNGKYKQVLAYEDRVYWKYNSKLLENSRLSHKNMHGTVLHRDHPFFNKNMPMCDYGCECFLTFHTKEECEKNGWNISTGFFPDIAKNGFDYDKRDYGWNGGGMSKFDIDASLEELPIIKEDKRLDTLSNEALKQEFYKNFGVSTNGGLFVDKIGDPILINDALFRSGAGFSKIKKRDRHLYLTYFTELIKDPDEIYMELEFLNKDNDELLYPNHRMVKKFFKYYKDEHGKKRALVALFTYLKDKTQGVTLHYINSASGIEGKRIEKLIYQKD